MGLGKINVLTGSVLCCRDLRKLEFQNLQIGNLSSLLQKDLDCLGLITYSYALLSLNGKGSYPALEPRV